MKHEIFVVIYLLVMGAIIISADVLFLREHFWWRLGVNVGIVALFAILYLWVFRNVFK